MDYETLLYRVDDGVLTLTLNRPEQLNAFVARMGDELIQAFRSASEDDAVRAVVVTGAGRAFCAGMNLETGGAAGRNAFGIDESLDPTLGELDARFDDPEIEHGVRDFGGRVTLAVFDCKKPVIAAINGPAVGFGATLTLAMDVRLAAETARIGFVFGRLGIVPEACSTWFLPRLVGLSKALELAYSARILDAGEALACGLVGEILAPDALLTRARALAQSFVTNRSPVSVALIRQMMYRNSALPDPRGAHLVESLAMLHTSRSDGREGVAAFLEKRPPEFSGRASAMPGFYPWWPG